MDATSDHRLREWAETDEEAYLVNPTRNVLTEVVRAIAETEADGIRCLVNPQTLRSFDREYSVASQMRDFTDTGQIQFHEMKGREHANILLSRAALRTCLDLGDSRVVTEVEADGQTVTDETLSDLYTRFGRIWERNDELRLRTPVQSEVRKSFEITSQRSVYERFETVVERMETEVKRNNTTGTGQFTDRQHTYAAVVIAGAVEQVTQGELGNATETCSLASRSTIYRFKRGLRESGLITVRNVESDRGGQTKQLALTEVYKSEDLETIVERAYSELSTMADAA